MIMIRIFIFAILFCSIPELKLVLAEDPPKSPAPPSGPSSSPGHEQKPESHSPPAPETNDDYYTLTYNAADFKKILPQDNTDAKAIKDQLDKSDPSYEHIAYILGRRSRTRRMVINQILEKDGHPLIEKTYMPQRPEPDGSIMRDVCFGLTLVEEQVIDAYIQNGLYSKEETQIIIGMVLTKDMESMVKTFNSDFDKTFDQMREKQRKPFRNMLRVWALKSREKDDPAPVNQDDVKKDADILLKEQEKWNDKFRFRDFRVSSKRDQLELILMRKSIKYARAVIAEFEKGRNNEPIENIINDTIKNKDLADAYSSLAVYVKDRHQYVANMLNLHMTEADGYFFSGWVMALATVKEEEWPKIDAAYKKLNQNGLSNTIGECHDVRYSGFHELIAMTIDPKYKPKFILAQVHPT